jgi:hypothetical protein
VTHAEGAEPADLDPLAVCERAADLIEQRLHGQFDVARPGEVRLPSASLTTEHDV